MRTLNAKILVSAVSFCLISSVAAAEERVFAVPLARGEGVSELVATSVLEQIVGEFRRVSSTSVLTDNDIRAMLTQEQFAQWTGCQAESCYAAIGQAAGARAVLSTRLGRVGKSWLLALRIIDTQDARVLASVDRRVKSPELDAVLDVVGAASGELAEKSKNTFAKTVASTTTPVAAAAGAAIPPGHAQKPWTGATAGQEWVWLEDPKSDWLVAFDKTQRQSGPIFAGTVKEGVYAQRVSSGSAEGDTTWSGSFWEPRAARWQANVGLKDGAYTVTCGERTVPLRLADAAAAKKIQSSVRFWDVRWQRYVVALIRDDEGVYYLVDRAREPEQNSDYRLFVGKKGAMQMLAIEDAVVDGSQYLLLTAQGRLKFESYNGDVAVAAWLVGDTGRALTPMVPYNQAPMIYTALGPYTGQPLGTVCDPYIP